MPRHLRAYSTADGKIIWDYDMAREFRTVNGIPGRGGAMDVGGPIVAGGMLFVSSGYARRSLMPATCWWPLEWNAKAAPSTYPQTQMHRCLSNRAGNLRVQSLFQWDDKIRLRSLPGTGLTVRLYSPVQNSTPKLGFWPVAFAAAILAALLALAIMR